MTRQSGALLWSCRIPPSHRCRRKPQYFFHKTNHLPRRDESGIGHVVNADRRAAFPQVQARADKIAAMAYKLGVRDSHLCGECPSIALGSSAVTPLEMASVYSTLAAGGVYSKPIAILTAPWLIFERVVRALAWH